MQKLKKFIIHNSAFAIVFILLIIPVLSLAAQDPSAKGLVTCTTDCGWNDLMALVNKVINFVLFGMAVPIAAIMFAYAGFLMLVPGSESAGKKTKGKEIFWNVVIGLVLAVAAWLIISTILFILGYEGAWIGLKIGV